MSRSVLSTNNTVYVELWMRRGDDLGFARQPTMIVGMAIYQKNTSLIHNAHE